MKQGYQMQPATKSLHSDRHMFLLCEAVGVTHMLHTSHKPACQPESHTEESAAQQQQQLKSRKLKEHQTGSI